MNLEAGGKHWTKDEITQRRETEVVMEKPVRLKCPKWLGPEAAKLFKSYAKELLASPLPVSNLDTGALARLCDAEALYAIAAKKRDEALENEEPEWLALWMKTMTSAEKIARGCANDLGCTISSRCRMVVPKAAEEEDDPLERLLMLRAE